MGAVIDRFGTESLAERDLVGAAHDGHHTGALGDGQLDKCRAETACRAEDHDGLTLRHTTASDGGVIRGVRGNQEARRPFVGHAVGNFEDRGDPHRYRRQAAERLDRHRGHTAADELTPTVCRVDDDADSFLARDVGTRHRYRVRPPAHRHVGERERGDRHA